MKYQYKPLHFSSAVCIHIKCYCSNCIRNPYSIIGRKHFGCQLIIDSEWLL